MSFGVSRLATTDCLLQEQLGQFTFDNHEWWYSPSLNILFCMDKGWMQHSLTLGGRRTRQATHRFSTDGIAHKPPPGLQWAILSIQSTHILLLEATLVTVTWHHSKSDVWWNSIQNLLWWALGCITTFGIPPFGKVQVQMVSDGLVKDTMVMAGVVIKAVHCTITIVTGMPPDQATPSVTHAELFGLYTRLVANLALTKSQEWHGNLEICCNSKATLAKLTCPIRCKITDCDLTTAIQLIWQQLQEWEVGYRQINGHQDRMSSALDLWVSMNVQADALAIQAHQTPLWLVMHFMADGAVSNASQGTYMADGKTISTNPCTS
jgi:hypothetical protein